MWIPAMAPVMWALWRFVLSADRLYAWQYSDTYPPPTRADHIYAATVFWTAVLTPVVVGLAAAIVAFRREYPARWTVLETGIVALPYLVLGARFPNEPLIMVASLLVGGAIVMSLLNLGACVRQRTWGKCALSGLAICGGALYLLWLYAFVIYVDT